MAQYAEIVDIIISPEVPQPGDTVWASIFIKNKYTAPIGIKCVAKFNSTTYIDLAANVSAGLTFTFGGHFTMPSGDVTIYASSYWHGSDGVYHLDDEESKVLAGAGEAWPASDLYNPNIVIPSGDYPLGSEVSYTMSWKYKGKPQNGQLTISIGRYSFAQTLYTFSPVQIAFNGSLDWVSDVYEGVFTIPGTLTLGVMYDVRATLKTDDGAQEVDTDIGVLSVTEDPTGVIEYVKVLKGSTELALPAAGMQVGDSFLLRVRVKNTCAISYTPYINYKYTKPDGTVLGSLEGKANDLSPGATHTFSEPALGIKVDQPGNWYIYVELKDKAGTILHTFAKTVLFNAGGAIPYTDLANVDITIATNTYEIGESVPFSVAYSYKGPAQSGILTISLGTGIDPTFLTKYTFPGIPTELQMSTDWKPGAITGSITLPSSLVPGQTYSVRGTLKTADNEVEKSETDYSVITIYEVPPLTGDILDVKLREGLITKILPAPDMVKNDYFSVLVHVKNTSSYEGRFFLDCKITKPSGATVGRTDEQQNLNPGQEHVYEIQPEGFGLWFRIDETGDWYVECVLRSAIEELDRTSKTHLFTAGSEGATSDLQVYEIEATLPSAHPILGPSDALKVGVTFKYTSTENAELQLWGSLSLATGRDIEAFKTIQLTKSLTEKTWSGDITLQVPATGKANGEYTLKVEVDGVETTITDAVTLENMPPTGLLGGIGDIGNLIMMMIVMMMMGLMMEQTRDLYEPAGTPPRPKPISETAAKGAKKAAEYGGKAVKKVVEYYR